MLEAIKKRSQSLHIGSVLGNFFLTQLDLHKSMDQPKVKTQFFFSQPFSKHVSWHATMHKFLNFPILILLLSDLISQGNSPCFCCSVLGGLLFVLSIIFCHRHKGLLVQLAIFLSKAYPLTFNKCLAPAFWQLPDRLEQINNNQHVDLLCLLWNQWVPLKIQAAGTLKPRSPLPTSLMKG